MSGVNKAGADWLILKKKINELIEDNRRLLETLMPESMYHFHRGQIAALREVLAFVEPTLTPVIEDENYG